MGLREDIKALYHENPNISSKQILETLGCKDTPQFWKILNDVQVGIRGVYPSQRKNRNRPVTHFDRTTALKRATRFTPPEPKE